MFKIISLSRQLSAKELLKSRRQLLKDSSSFFASKSHQKQKDEQISYGDYQAESETKKEEFLPNLFLTSFEMYNLSEEEKEKYKKLKKEPLYKKFKLFTKSFLIEIKKFVYTDLFLWDFLKEEKYVNDLDIDVKWIFKSKDDIKGWLIACDSMLDQGFSTANLDVNKQGRLLFSGYLDSDNIPADGVISHTGFAHLSSPLQKGGFGFESYFNWSNFNHLLIRFRGDGRAYKVLLKAPSLQGLQTDSYYEYFLYTRGGPYWQVAKIPFSKFVLCYKSRIQDKKQPVITMAIQSLSFTLSKYTGPFKLEISHIGLQSDARNYQQFDYETYFRPEMPF